MINKFYPNKYSVEIIFINESTFTKFYKTSKYSFTNFNYLMATVENEYNYNF